MNQIIINQIAKLRVLVGYLGEKDQFNWWASSFFSKSSDAYLSPIFTKSIFLAQYTGVKEAASIVHDERVGLGDVYHLFRLPEYVEQDLMKLFRDTMYMEEMRNVITDKESILGQLCDDYSEIIEGPMNVCTIKEFFNQENINIVSSMYYTAFVNGKTVYPYFIKYF